MIRERDFYYDDNDDNDDNDDRDDKDENDNNHNNHNKQTCIKETSAMLHWRVNHEE